MDGQSVSRFAETGFNATPYFWRTPCAAATQAADGDVSRIDKPATASCTSPVTKKNVLLWTMGPPAAKPNWLLRISCFELPGSCNGESAASASLRSKKK